MPREPIVTLHPTLTADAIPLWQRINNLFNATGWPEPGTRLRDELVGMLDHALAYGELKAEHENVMDSICRTNR